MNRNDALTVRKTRIKEQSIREGDVRTEFERDYGRLIHSPAFRRLQGKSQIFGAGTGDYFRTRLTHSLEVAQISKHVAIKLMKLDEIRRMEHPGLIIDPTVVECASLAHDIGHPPFGHKGENELNNNLRNHDLHFEGNAQNFRILMFLEETLYGDGLNLTNAVLLGLNKYPYIGSQSNKKGLYNSEWDDIARIRSEWGLIGNQTTLEAQIMDLCDDIAYSTHDIEDGIKAGKIEYSQEFLEYNFHFVVEELKSSRDPLWRDVDLIKEVESVLKEFLRVWKDTYKRCNKNFSLTRKEFKAIWVNKFVSATDILDDGNGWKKVTFVREGSEDKDLLRKLIILKKLAWVTMVKDLRVQRLQKRSEKIINGLWDSFQDYNEACDILPKNWISRFYKNTSDWQWKRLVSDYISGMTDSYAEKVYSELFGIHPGSIFDVN